LCTTPMVILATLHQRICRSEAWVLTHQPPVYIVQMLPTSSLLLIRQPYATTLPPLLCDRIASVRRVNTMWGSAGTCIASHISSQFIKFLLFRPLAVEKGAPGSYWFFMRAARNGHVRLKCRVAAPCMHLDELSIECRISLPILQLGERVYLLN
jgi:hypothetical protein